MWVGNGGGLIIAGHAWPQARDTLMGANINKLLVPMGLLTDHIASPADFTPDPNTPPYQVLTN